MSDENGHEPKPRRQLGRRGPEPPQFTFPDSGVTVGLYPVSPDTLSYIHKEVNRLHPMPTPKKKVVLVGETQEPAEEEVQDGEFAQALYQHAQVTGQEIGRRLFKLGMRQMVFVVDEEALNAWKTDMEAIEVPVPDDVSDRELYIRNIIISTQKDLNAFMDYFMRVSQPTEAAVQEMKAEFPDQVMG